MADSGRVDFYVISGEDPAEKSVFACRLAEKAYRLDHRVHLHTESAAAAARLDELLWTFRQGSFVPHEPAQAGQPAHSPVTVGHGDAAPPADLLINLAPEVPAFERQFARIAEIVDESAEERRRGRERYRSYQQSGRELDTHRMSGGP